MTSTPAFALSLVIAALGAGCAADGVSNPAEPAATREYRTGSNIPRKETAPTTEAERAHAVEQARELQRDSAPGRVGN